MEIQPTYVTFEQAKLLKEKGFDVECLHYYIEVNNNHSNHPTRTHDSQLVNWNSRVSRVSCPEQHQVVEWLRMNCNIWIELYYDFITFDVKIKRPENEEIELYSSLSGLTQYKFITPQEAYSAAFDHVLKNLI